MDNSKCKCKCKMDVDEDEDEDEDEEKKRWDKERYQVLEQRSERDGYE